MINEFYINLAKIAVNYSVEVKKGHRVLISGPDVAKELVQALYLEIIKAGGHPFAHSFIEGLAEIQFKYGSDEQLEYVDNTIKQIMREFDSQISIFADYNTKKLANVDPKKIAISQASPGHKELMEIMEKRTSDGTFKWVIVPYPCQSFAQEAKMDLFSYTEFVKKALMLDKENPVEEWRKVQKKQDEIVKYLNKVEDIQVIGEDTKLSLSTKGRTWRNCCGQRNLPDGEVFTGPVEDSVNGYIRFTFPGIYGGQEIENIYLEFKDGKVVRGTADKGEELLQEILKIENADIIGEFAVGTNYGIQTFTKNMLFDEKMGGTLHCALGLGFEQTGSKNRSAIHWDILKDMKLPGSKILADGKIIYEDGKWKI
jgi:aminopeptidase